MNEPINTTSTDPKVVSIVAYLTLIGWIVALVLNNPKSTLGSFHIRQSLGILLLGFGFSIISIVPLIGWIISIMGYLLVFALWVIGFISAVQAEEKPVPFVGEMFQEWFKSL